MENTTFNCHLPERVVAALCEKRRLQEELRCALPANNAGLRQRLLEQLQIIRGFHEEEARNAGLLIKALEGEMSPGIHDWRTQDPQGRTLPPEVVDVQDAFSGNRGAAALEGVIPGSVGVLYIDVELPEEGTSDECSAGETVPHTASTDNNR
jgi:hypothetical protein